MSTALQSIGMDKAILLTLAKATRQSKRKDQWFADRLDCGREYFNKVKNRRAVADLDFICRWAALLGLEIVAVRPQQNGEGENG